MPRIPARAQHQNHSRHWMLSQRHVHEVHRALRRLILHGFRHSHDLNRRPGAAIEADAFAHSVASRPKVLREAHVHDRDPRRIGGVGRQKGAAAQDRNPHRLEVSLVHRVHHRTEIGAIRRHLETVRHEGHAVKVGLPQWHVLRQSHALHSGSSPHPFGQHLVELLRLRGVVLNEPRIETGHQQMIFREIAILHQVVLKAAGHQERRSQQHQRHSHLRHH